jgi:hypothetical protein
MRNAAKLGAAENVVDVEKRGKDHGGLVALGKGAGSPASARERFGKRPWTLNVADAAHANRDGENIGRSLAIPSVVQCFIANPGQSVP